MCIPPPLPSHAYFCTYIHTNALPSYIDAHTPHIPTHAAHLPHAHPHTYTHAHTRTYTHTLHGLQLLIHACTNKHIYFLGLY